jgi:hypothetical protein
VIEPAGAERYRQIDPEPVTTFNRLSLLEERDRGPMRLAVDNDRVPGRLRTTGPRERPLSFLAPVSWLKVTLGRSALTIIAAHVCC